MLTSPRAPARLLADAALLGCALILAGMVLAQVAGRDGSGVWRRQPGSRR